MGQIDLNKQKDPEYKTFMDWFRLMNKNHYIHIFLLAVVFFVVILLNFEPTWGFCVAIAIPSLMMIVIAYKGFYQFWKDMQNGRSR
jgi:inner membrane protein involved in colicin E2 resistance